MEAISLPSYAKINLGLLILSKKKDGYHNIATVFQQIDLHDDITLRKISDGIRIISNNPALPMGKNNLVYRAFELIQSKLGFKGGIEINIEKRIPMGAGLGGGSSNAAVTLVGANRLWGEKLSLFELEEMAAEIGSDVPFFIRGGTALGQGRGEILTPFKWSDDWWVVLVSPGIEVSTSWAYQQAKIVLTKGEKFTKFRSIFEKYDPHALRQILKNDLEGVVFQRHPILRTIKETMYQRDAFYASMSGSGSSVYGLFFRQDQAKKAQMFFSIEQGMTTFLCRPISLHL